MAKGAKPFRLNLRRDLLAHYLDHAPGQTNAAFYGGAVRLRQVFHLEELQFGQQPRQRIVEGVLQGLLEGFVQTSSGAVGSDSSAAVCTGAGATSASEVGADPLVMNRARKNTAAKSAAIATF